jgi:hypothetical protein
MRRLILALAVIALPLACVSTPSRITYTPATPAASDDVAIEYYDHSRFVDRGALSRPAERDCLRAASDDGVARSRAHDGGPLTELEVYTVERAAAECLRERAEPR